MQGGRVAAQRQHGPRQVQHGVRDRRAAPRRCARPARAATAATGRRASRGRAPWSTGSARGSRRARPDRRRARAGTCASCSPSSSPANRNGVPRSVRSITSGRPRAGLRAAQPRAHARLVVVGEDPGRPALAHDLLDVRDARAPRAGLPRHRQRLEVEGEVQLVAVAEVGRDELGLGEVDLADHHAVAGVLVEHGANAAQERVRALVVVGADDVEVAADDVGLGDVGQRGVLADEVHDVGAEAVDAAVQPEAQHVVHGLDDLRVVPVEVGLLGQEGVQVPLLGGLVPRPRGAAAEGRRPVVGRAVRRAVVPAVPVRAWASRATRGSRRTTGAGRRCGWAPSPAARGCRARAHRRAGRRRSRGRRRAGRRRSSRPRRSRSRPSASGRSATARARRPRATAGAPAARAALRGRRRRRPRRRRTSADRSGRRPTPATTCGGEGYGPATDDGG